MSTEALLRQAVKGALALGAAGSMAGAGAALAQTAPAAGTSGGATKLSQIIVTGSHIPRTSIATAQPVITINRQEINNTGFTTVGQLLQNMSSSGSALNVQFNNGGDGEQLINLHDLGSNRVLVLVNGQRWVPDLGGAVDLTTIPLAVVDRVEVLLDGASAVYGSEAIAGVINIITKKNYNGAEAHAYYGAYDGHGDGGGWDGKTQQYSFTVGTSTDKSGVLLSAGYYQQQAVWAGQRTISKEPYVGFGNQNGSSGSLGGRFFTLNQIGNPLPNGCYPASVTTSGYNLCDLSGPDAHDPSGYHTWSNLDRYNYAPANYLRTPQERWYIFSQGHYDLTDNVTFNFMTTYQRRNSSQVLAPNPWFFGPYGGETQNGQQIGMAKNALGNPFGVDLVPYYPSSTTAFQNWCTKYGSPTCTSQYDIMLLYGRRPIEVGNRDFSQNNQTFYFNGGFTGYFDVDGNEWNWNANYIYGQVLETQITQGLANTARIQSAVSYGCASDPTCVPLNLFGGAGTITPAMANYIMFTAHDVTKEVLRDYNAGLNGSFFNNWYAGAWGFAAGYEYEAYDGFNSPDPLVSSGNTVGNVTQPTTGRENTNAQYVELNVPFANNAPLAKSLGIDVAERWSQFHYNGIGNIFDAATQSVTTGAEGKYAHSATPRATFKWQPIQSLLLRATWSQGFRIPSLTELFFGASDNYPALTDPCVGQPGYPNCPANATQPNGQIKTTIGGNAQLDPEKSTTRTAGFVWSPGFAPGFDFSADYYKTEVTNRIARAGGQYYLNACNLPGDATNAPACSYIVRTSGGTVTNILDLQHNGGSQLVEGWDINTRYKLPTMPFGDITLALTMNFMQKDIACNAAGQCTDYAGTASGGNFFGQPHHRYNFTVDWNYGPWSATWRMQVIGPMWEDCTQSPLNFFGAGGGAESITGNAGAPRNFGWCSKISSYTYDSSGQPFAVAVGQNHLGTTVYNDLSASYTVSSWNTTFTLGCNNFLDKQPPISRTSFANSYLPVYYDTPGRFFYGRISVTF